MPKSRKSKIKDATETVKEVRELGEAVQGLLPPVVLAAKILWNWAISIKNKRRTEEAKQKAAEEAEIRKLRNSRLLRLVGICVAGATCLFLVAKLVFDLRSRRVSPTSPAAQTSPADLGGDYRLSDVQTGQLAWVACGVEKTRAWNRKSPFSDLAIYKYLAGMCPDLGAVNSSVLERFVGVQRANIRSGRVICRSYNPPVVGLDLRNQTYTDCAASVGVQTSGVER